MINKPFPPGWRDEERVRRVLAHYEAQTEEEAVTEDERAFDEGDRTIKDLGSGKEVSDGLASSLAE